MLLELREADGTVNHLHLYYVPHPTFREWETGGRVVTHGDFDLEAEEAAAELGFEPSKALLVKQEWERSPVDFITSKEYLRLFFENLSAQGAGSLGKVSEKDILNLIRLATANIIAEVNKPPQAGLGAVALGTGPFIAAAPFLHWVRTYWSYFEQPRPADGFTNSLALMAYLNEYTSMLDELRQMTSEPLYELRTDCRCRASRYKTHVRCDVAVELVVGGESVDGFEISGEGLFIDAELQDWTVEADEENGYPDDTSTHWLYYIEEPVEPVDFLKKCPMMKRPEAPDPFSNSGYGQYGVFVSTMLIGVFDHLKDAKRFASMSHETMEREEGWSSVGVYQKLPMEDFGPDTDPFDIEWDDIENWMELY